MKSICLFLLTCLSVTGMLHAQKNYSELTSDEKSRFSHIDSNRTRNRSFALQTLYYSAMSYASPPLLDVGGPKAWYILSADISPQFVIGGDWMRFPIHITTRFKARIFRERPEIGDSSLPVRTPSYMPGASIYFPLSYIDDQTPSIRYLSLSVFHHSNGQDGREFYSDGKVNTYNGNFSTNFVEAAYHFRKRTTHTLTSPTCPGEADPYVDFYGRLGYEQHFSTATALKKSYGDNRVNLLLGWIDVKSYCDKVLDVPVTEAYYREKFRYIWNTSFILSARNRGLSALKKRINTDFNFHWRIPSSPNTSLFAGAGYYGSDPYNIYYEDSYFFVHAGIALGFFVAPGILGSRKRLTLR